MSKLKIFPYNIKMLLALTEGKISFQGLQGIFLKTILINIFSFIQTFIVLHT